YNLLARIEGETADPGLVYLCHMDTVTLGDGWNEDPLGAVERDGRIYGRGACDMKSGLACAMSAFAAIAACGRKPKHSFSFIATVDEEDFMRGVERVIQSGWVTKNSWVLDTEPTHGQIQVAHKGRTWFELTVNGCTAHASTPWKGADAIAAISAMIVKIREWIDSCPKHEDLGFSTVTFGQIEGGYRPYVVPDHCTVWIDMRLVPPTDTACASRIVEEAIRYGETFVPGAHGSYRITGDRPYVEKHDDSYLLKQLSQVCKKTTAAEAAVTYFPGYTDSAVVAGTLGNRNCMSYGPGDLELAHKPDESVPCSDILRCEQVLTALAKQILFS
ncbi:MAG: M20 family metallopeptidase, partial [Hungatella sp.]